MTDRPQTTDDPAYHGMVCLDCGWRGDAARLKIIVTGAQTDDRFHCPVCLSEELDYALDR